MDPDSYLCRLAELFDGVTVYSPSLGAIIAITLAVLLLFASGFVSASEIAFFSLSPSDLSEIEEENHSSDKHITALLPKQMQQHGLKKSDIELPKKTVAAIIDQYTRESGVRLLDKMIAKVMRKVALKKAEDAEYKPSIEPEELRDYLGVPTNIADVYEGNDYAGVVTGLVMLIQEWVIGSR